MNKNIDLIDEIKFVSNSPNFYFDHGIYNRDLKNFLRRIRNGIAHQNIKTTNENGKWKGVIIQDINPQNNVVGLNLELTTRELRSFAYFIADSYLSELEKY